MNSRTISQLVRASFSLLCPVLMVLRASSQDYMITAFGASTDSTVLNTLAIQNAIDKANDNGGGTIVIPKGVYLTGAIFFKPKTKLRLMEGAVLKGSDDISNYPLMPSRMEGQNLLYYPALINAYYVDSFSIAGPGTIDGNGLKFWEEFWAHRDAMSKIGKSSTNLEVHRPRLLFIWGCNDVTIQNVKLHNSGFWTTHLYECNNVLLEGCDIRAPFKPVPAPSSDGVDIDVCKRVTVRNCYISVNDDAVCVKGGKGPRAHELPQNGPGENILIENCTFGDSHGTLTLGSECVHANHVTIRNCIMDNHAPLLRLKMRPDTYQVYENVSVENITGSCGTIIEMLPWKQFFNMAGSKAKPFGTIHNISFSNIRVKCKSFGVMQGNPLDTVSSVVFKNIIATCDDPVLKTKYKSLRVEKVSVNGKPLVVQ